jgi:hypothetical protein
MIFSILLLSRIYSEKGKKRCRTYELCQMSESQITIGPKYVFAICDTAAFYKR